MNIGTRIREAREAKGWRIRHLARELDTTEAYVSNVERGTVNPGADRLLQFARALGVTPNDLFGIEPEALKHAG